MALADIFKRKKKDYVDMGDTGLGPGSFGPAEGASGMPGMDQGMPQMPGGEAAGLPPMEFPQQSPMTPPSMPMPQQGASQQTLDNIRSQLESLNYKIDTLRAVLDSLNTRLANIETALKASPLEKGEGGWTY